ncbi:hypothetical protein BCL76_103136 [Streptomyces sp. CG 926]|nr:hypothetical protein BCL76_103136 [Streptomyces sp. CG 926]
MTFPSVRSVMSSWPETIRHERWASARATPSRSECGLPINATVVPPLASTTACTNENRSRSTENGGTGGGTLLQPRNARRNKGGPSSRRTTSSAQASPDTECPGRGYPNSTRSRSAAPESGTTCGPKRNSRSDTSPVVVETEISAPKNSRQRESMSASAVPSGSAANGGGHGVRHHGEDTGRSHSSDAHAQPPSCRAASIARRQVCETADAAAHGLSVAWKNTSSTRPGVLRTVMCSGRSAGAQVPVSNAVSSSGSSSSRASPSTATMVTSVMCTPAASVPVEVRVVGRSEIPVEIRRVDPLRHRRFPGGHGRCGGGRRNGADAGGETKASCRGTPKGKGRRHGGTPLVVAKCLHARRWNRGLWSAWSAGIAPPMITSLRELFCNGKGVGLAAKAGWHLSAKSESLNLESAIHSAPRDPLQNHPIKLSLWSHIVTIKHFLCP